VYSRDELEILVSDERVPLDRRVFYALCGIGLSSRPPLSSTFPSMSSCA